MRKITYLIIISFVIMFVLSCRVKDSIDEIQKLRTIEKTEDYGALSDFLKSLPKNQQENAQTPYNEINTFLKGRNEILASNYKEGFETLARFLFTYHRVIMKARLLICLGRL